MEDNSHIALGKRVKKSKLFPKRWQHVDSIPADEACILALPGSNADNSKKANGFAKMIEEMLKKKALPIYSVEYNLAERNFRIDREALLARYHQENPNLPFIRYVKEEDKTYTPQYIKELYHMTIAPRLRDENGNRVSIQTASQRLNMLILANHCQGSTVALHLENLMVEDMQKLGYAPNVRTHLLKQLHSLNVAPVTPYAVMKTTAYKFVSFADDRVTSVHTPKIEYILKRKEEHERFLAGLNQKNTEKTYTDRPFMMNFALFRPTQNETVFAVNNMYPIEIQQNKDYDGIEHSFDSYSYKDDDDRTKQGDQLSTMFRELLNRLAENAKQNETKLQEFPDIFQDPALKPLLSRAQSNRYDFITKETKILKTRKNNTR